MKKTIVKVMVLLSIFFQATTSKVIAAEVEYIYDDLNRVRDVIYDGQAKITYTHDDVNNRENEITDSDGDGIADNLDPSPFPQ